MTRQRACVAFLDKEYAVEREAVTITQPSQGRWKNGIVTYKLINDTGDIEGNKLESKAVNLSLLEWGRFIKDIRFKRVYGNDPADMVAQFNGKDPYFNSSDGILAYTWYPSLNNNLAGDMVINDTKTLRWSLDGKSKSAFEAYQLGWIDYVTYQKFPNNTYKTINLRQVLTHEFGHALGLAHNTACKQCMMYPYYHNDIFLAENDIDRIQEVYHKRTINSSYLESLRRIIGKPIVG